MIVPAPAGGLKPTASQEEAYPGGARGGVFLGCVHLSPTDAAELRREPNRAAPWAPLGVNARPEPALASNDRSPTRVSGSLLPEGRVRSRVGLFGPAVRPKARRLRLAPRFGRLPREGLGHDQITPGPSEWFQ